MDVNLAAEEVKLEVEESEVEIEMNTDEAALYIACTMTPAEIEQGGLTHVVRQRRYKTGARPGLTCKAVVGGPSQRLDDRAWIPPARKPGRRQKRRMAGCVLRSACRLVLQTTFILTTMKLEDKQQEVPLEQIDRKIGKTVDETT